MSNNKYHETLINELFTADAEFSREHFTKIALSLRPTLNVSRKSERDVIKANMGLVSVQQLINRHLRSQGKMLKSRNYYSSFYVIQDKPARKEVARYIRTARNLSSCAERLKEGLDMRQKVLDLKTL